MKILVTRPLPGGETSAARLRALGCAVVTMPLLAVEAIDWDMPAAPPDAIMLTSAAAARMAGAPAAALHGCTAWAVGDATAAAARAAGFTDVRDGGGSVQALVDRAAAAGIGEILHLAGADRTTFTVPTGLTIIIRTVYRARLLPLAGAVDADWVLLYSSRTAAHFAAECDRLGHDRAGIAIAAISPAVLAAAGPGWAWTTVAATPDEDALLAAIGLLCQ